MALTTEDQQTLTEPPGPIAVHSTLDALRQEIWSKRPILGEIMRKHGGKILHDYAQDFLDINPTPGLDARKPEIITAVRDLVKKRLGKEVATRVALQLSKYPLVSTADHHGPIDHPFWVNANIISAIPYARLQDPILRTVVVFSFASVSVNNASAFPRGILFHGGVGESGNLIRLPILPDKLKMGVVYNTRAFTREDLTKAEAELAKKEKAGDIAHGRGDQIREVMERFLGRQDVLSAPDLNTQISIINYHLWPHLFHAAVGEQASGYPIPDLLYLEIETLVTELLLRHHLGPQSTLVQRVLFEPAWTTQAMDRFNNLPGAFSLEEGWGTYFFWGLDEKSHRVRLMLKDGFLRSDTDAIRVPWTREGIAHALRNRTIFPGMLTCYLMVSLYYGMKCLGGFCQVNDLTMVKTAWTAMLRELGEESEAFAIEPVQTKELGGDGMVLAYYRTPTDHFVPATGIDMVLHTGNTTFEKYYQRSAQVTLTEMTQPMLPEMYTVLYPAPERNTALLAVSAEQILEQTGLKEKLTRNI